MQLCTCVKFLYNLCSVVGFITSTKSLEPFPTYNVQGLQVDSLFAKEFTDFQNHWLSANKTLFPGSSFDTTEVNNFQYQHINYMCTPYFMLLYTVCL